MFQNMPKNFVFSVLRANNKKKLNLPSCQLYPRMSACGTHYRDLVIKKVQNFAYFTLKQAEGVPLISNTGRVNDMVFREIKSNFIISNYIIVCLFDKTKKQFYGNVA